MSTKYHDPIPVGADVTSESVNAPMGQLDEQLGKLYENVDPTGNLVLDGKWDGEHVIMGEGHWWVHDGHLWFLFGREPANGTDGINLSDR